MKSLQLKNLRQQIQINKKAIPYVSNKKQH